MKRGTILENDYTAVENPLHYSIYTGTSGQLVNVIHTWKGGIRKSKYYKHDVGDDKAIHPVRESDILQRIYDMVHKELWDYCGRTEDAG